MKTILITGGAQRLGKALVEAFALDGWRVLFTAQHSFEAGVALAERLCDQGGFARCLRASVSSRSNATMIASWAQEWTQAEGLDALVCNASSLLRRRVEETTEDDMEHMLRSNFVGPYFLAQQCFPGLQKNGGVIVNIADVAADRGAPDFSAYMAAKAALISSTKSMALAFSPHVRANAVLPGSLPWPQEGGLDVAATYPEAEKAAMVAAIPLGRVGGWADAVGAVRYLVDAPYITGTCIPVDGGRSAVF